MTTMLGLANHSGEFDVLIVDPNGETNEVIATVLQRHGLQTRAADSGADGLAKLRTGRPQVTVLNLDGQSDHQTWNHDFSKVSRELGRNLIVLGDESDSGGEEPVEADERIQFINKPYRYGPLIRTIETLVGKHANSRGDSKRSAA